MKVLTILLALSVCSFVSAQTNSFKEFLSNFKQVENLSKNMFGKSKISDNILDKQKNAKYLPNTEKECLCNEEDIFWQLDGSYSKQKNFILLFIKRHCGEYKDANEKHFMENIVTDYMLITYTLDGKIISQMSLGREGNSYLLEIEYEKPLTFIADEGYIDEVYQIFHSKELTYTIMRKRVSINRQGTISCNIEGTPWQKTLKNTRHIVLGATSAKSELLDFYRAYMTDGSNKDSLYNKYLTDNVRAKMSRVAQVTNNDFLLRTHKYSEYGKKSLTCKCLNGYWYEIAYQLAPNTDSIKIPIRIIDESADVRICYVLPEWGGEVYNDSLLWHEYTKIDSHNPEKFLQTFYQQYSNIYNNVYISADENAKRSSNASINNALLLLRQSHCTKEFIFHYDSLKQSHYNKTKINYDAIIDNYDFDVFWLPSLKITNIAPLQYEVSYNISPSINKSFIVILKRLDNCYKIDRITYNSLNLTFNRTLRGRNS